MITIITGTNRKNNNSQKVSETYRNILNDRGIESQILNLVDLHSNFMTDDMYGKRTSEGAQLIEKYIDNVSQFIFVIPEYNGSFPGVLKLFIDAIEPARFNYKNAILIGVASGRAGNLRGLDHFATVLNHLKMEFLSNKILLSKIDTLLNEKDLIGDEISLKLIGEQLDLMGKVFGKKL